MHIRASGEIMPILQLLFSTQGRVSRQGYWLVGVGLVIASSVAKFGGLVAIWGFDFAMVAVTEGTSMIHLTPVSAFLWVLTLLFLVPGILLSIKRWHDRNRPGWFAAAIPLQYVLAVVIAYVPANAAGLNVCILSANVALFAWQFIELGCLEGAKGPNKYGPSPKGIGATPDVF